LEQRVAANAAGWSVNLVPPVLPLPTIETKDGQLTDAGSEALATSAWAARRLGLPVAVSGGSEKDRSALMQALAQSGVTARVSDGARKPLSLSWDVPVPQDSASVRA
jgi:hypothetical protein